MLYIHIPFCHRKCTYCAFYSAVTSADKQDYVDALCAELRVRRHCMEHPLRTVYFGGGTPTLLSVAQIGHIVAAIADNYDIHALEEVTVEANPEDLSPQFLEGLRQLHFFNRLSVGVQSFRNEDLRLLNRRHDALQAVAAVRNAVSAGFSNISIDLIYGLPGQSLQLWEENLAVAATLPITHLSAYALTVEDGTMLQRQIATGTVAPADEDMVLSHYHALQQWTVRNGFEQYEISNYSRPGCRAVHNSRYWNRTPYLGVGAAAHSFDGCHRRWNVADVRRYVSGAAVGRIEHDEEDLGLKDAYNEYLMTALRTVEGIAKADVATPFAGRLKRDIARYVAAGLIVETPTHYRPTPEGLLHADGIAAEIFVD